MADNPNSERSFIMIKPDGVARNLVGEIISRIEKKGLKIVALKMQQVTQEHAEKHYADLSARSFFPSLVEYIISSPVVAIVVEGLNAVAVGRLLVGATNPADAAPGTIRFDYAMQIGRNLIHASDAVESANHEIGLWFTDAELCAWDLPAASWIYE